ncbi:MAG: hypothetical protein J5I98_23495 [Phaeodactylibacter sp.]|nr:hypothetical protein [Phaeodactylibacter sp.]
MSVYNNGGAGHIEPVYPLLNKIPSGFEDHLGNDIKGNRNTYALGATAHYKHSFGAFEFGLSYSFALSANLITTDYLRYQNNALIGQSRLNYKGDYIAVEASYVIPLFRSKKKVLPRHLRPKKPPKPPKSSRPRPGRPSPKQPDSDPLLRQVIPSLKSCFNTSDTRNLRYEENHFKFNQNSVEFELYHKDGLDDGDMVTVCVDGQIQLNKLRLTDRGTRFTVNTAGKREVNIVIYTESGGSQGNTSLGF